MLAIIPSGIVPDHPDFSSWRPPKDRNRTSLLIVSPICHVGTLGIAWSPQRLYRPRSPYALECNLDILLVVLQALTVKLGEWSWWSDSNRRGQSQRLTRPLQSTSMGHQHVIATCYILNYGPSGGAQTHGLMVPNHALYQLSYTRILIMNGMSLA